MSVPNRNAAPESTRSAGVPRVGDRIADKFVVQRVLGSGGMGVVVEARHETLNELVAIKILRNDAKKDPAMGERFLREAKASLRIKSEHVARVHDIGTTATGLPYLVMEHLTGADLATWLAERGPLPIREAVDFILQACEAIAEAHSLGIVHRDIKPSNLFVTYRPDHTPLVKVLDFGIAKAESPTGQSITLTEPHSVFGSPAYMSPEQIRSAKTVDARGDVWSLGVVLFELLAGCIPFEGESSAAVLAAVSADEPRALKTLRPDVPSELSAIVGKCLVKDPTKRVQSVLELVSALAPYGGGHAMISVERVRRMAEPLPGMYAPTSAPGSVKPRALTARAWATTDAAPPSVDKSAPTLAEAPRSRWPMLAVTAAVIGIVGAAAISGVGRSRQQPAAAAPAPVAATDAPAAVTMAAKADAPPAVLASASAPASASAAPASTAVGRAVSPRAPARVAPVRAAPQPSPPASLSPAPPSTPTPPPRTEAPSAAPADPMKTPAAADWR